MRTTVGDVDRLIAEWQEKLHAIDDNLLALERDTTMEFLERMVSSGSGLEGVTQQRVGPALAAFWGIIKHRALLDDTVQQAVRLRGRVRLLLTEKTLTEIVELFSEPSITLPMPSLPLGQRGLLTAAQSISPDALLREMVQAYETVRDLVTAIGQAWDQQERELSGAARELADLQRRAADLGQSVPELEALGAEISDLRARILSDPLGVSDDWMGRLRPRVAGVRSSIARAQEQHADAAARLDQAHQLIRALADLQASCEQVAQELSSSIADVRPVHIPVSAEQVAGLRVWLQTLQELAASGKWDALTVGLGRWSEAATRYQHQLAANAEANRKPVDERDDLLGLLSARRAQASALLLRGVLLPPELTESAMQAETLLRAQPAHVDAARPLVAQYDQGVKAAAAPHHAR